MSEGLADDLLKARTAAWFVRLLGSHLDPEESNGEFGDYERKMTCRFLAEYAALLDAPGAQRDGPDHA